MRTIWLYFLSLVAGLPLLPQASYAQIRDNAGFKTKSIPRNDDGSGPNEALGWTLNFFGVRFTTVYVNNNGNITFDAPLATFTPFGLDGVHRQIIAPFFADVDTRSKFSNLVTYGSDTVNSRRAFGVNWLDVGYFNQHDDKTNSFQLVLIEREDTGSGNFDIEFNYSRIKWETGDASDGVNGFGGTPASAGWSNGTGLPGTSYQLPGSLVAGSFLDGGSYSLSRGRTPGAVTVTGRWLYRARGGTIIPALSISTGCPIPNASASRPYSFRFEGAGSKPPYRWALLPDPDSQFPLTLNAASGLLTGVLPTPGQYGFTIRLSATDEDGELTVSRRCSITTDPPNLTILSDPMLPAATSGVSYTARLRADGGTGPFRFELVNSTPVPGLTLNPNGTFSGTPLAAGNYALLVSVTSGGSDQAVPSTKRFTITVRPAEVSVRGSCPLANGAGNVPYNYQFEAEGGLPPYRWTLMGVLPTGLFMGPDGRVNGIPTVPHWWPFSVGVVDSRGSSAVLACGVVILFPEVQMTGSCPMPVGTAGVPYSRRLNATGGSGSYTWSVVDGNGTLPAGLRLSDDGTVSGTPQNSGPAQFRLRVQDARGQTASNACSLTINPGAFSITSCPLPGGFAGEVYRQQIGATGGRAPYIFSSPSNLPAGLSLTPAGVLSGLVPPGTYPINLRVNDVEGQVASKQCDLSVMPPAVRLTTQCPLPDAIIGSNYRFAVTAAGGVEPYSYSSSPLPAGLRLGPDGMFAGISSTAGFYPLVLSVRDANNQRSTQACGLTVDLPPLPDLKITGLPLTLAPAVAGPRFTVDLASAYPVQLDGEVRMTVTPDTGSSNAAVDRADPALRLANGPFLVPFTLKPGDRTASFQITGTGTVASVVTVVAGNIQAGGVPFARQAAAVTRVVRQVPVLTNVCYSPTPGGFSVDISGYSTTRDVTNAILTFGSNSFSVDLTASSQEFFSNDESVRTGGTFRITAPYRMTNGNAQSLGQGTATVLNSAGAAASRPIAKCN